MSGVQQQEDFDNLLEEISDEAMIDESDIGEEARTEEAEGSE